MFTCSASRACQLLLLLLTCVDAYRTKRGSHRVPRSTRLNVGGHTIEDVTNWHGVRRLRRPNFIKFLRCTGQSAESCEECKDKSQCMTHLKGNRIAVNANNRDYERYVGIVELRCSNQIADADPLVSVVPQLLVSGWERVSRWQFTWRQQSAFRVYVNSVDVSPGIEGRFRLPLRRVAEDAVEAKVEFHVLPEMHFPVRAEILFEVQGMDEQFIQCEDHKVCLSKLWQPFAKFPEAGKMLRSNNLMQYQCLSHQTDSFSRDLTETCMAWRECLGRAGTEATVKMILNASRLSEELSAPECTDYDGCIDPDNTDVEGWACNCMDNWKGKCANIGMAEDARCLTAAYCHSDLVCPCWKAKACTDPEYKHIYTQLSNSGAYASMLQQRGSEVAEQVAADMEQSMGSKGCI